MHQVYLKIEVYVANHNGYFYDLFIEYYYFNNPFNLNKGRWRKQHIYTTLVGKRGEAQHPTRVYREFLAEEKRKNQCIKSIL